MKLDDKKIKDILLKEDYVAKEDIDRAEVFAKTHRVSLVDYFLSEGILSKDILGQAIAEYYKVPYADLNSHPPSKEQVQAIPEDIAKELRIIIFSWDNKKVVIATDDLEQEGLKEKLKDLFPERTFALNYSLEEDIEKSFMHYHKPLKTRFAQIIESKGRVAPEIIEEIIEDAIIFNASDIHFEPEETEVIVRFRVDGVLQEAGRIPKEYYENVLNRIKVEAHLRIDEHLSAQDGAMRYSKKNKDTEVDIRVSIVPTLEGEKIVIRLLSEYMRSLSLSDLGLSKQDQDMFEEVARKPFGMILISGPTGSGKTTTLYSILKILNDTEKNITTIEDPAEYRIQGINQIQVNTNTNLTFAKGLRSIVRQDPDVILVGEIRDRETAEIAINAAMTGHLLFSTFHANDAATSILRLLDMGVEPFLLASTLELLGSQRLVRKICDSCKSSYSISQADLKKEYPKAYKYFSEQKATLYKGKGCTNCNNTGFHGRMAIYEFIKNTPEIQDLILKNVSSKEIWGQAKKQGSRYLFEDGVEKVKNGVTTIDELLRVASPPTFIGNGKK